MRNPEMTKKRSTPLQAECTRFWTADAGFPRNGTIPGPAASNEA